MDDKMDFQAISKLKKYPTAAAALVFSAVFSFLLAPEKLLETIDFYLVWGLSTLFAIHIWYNFKEDRSYKVSGIVPAWLELIAGTLLLFFYPVREISLIFIMLAVCSYAAGIIFSVKVTGPIVLFLGVAPKLISINNTLSEVMALIFSKTCYFTTGKEPEEIFVISDLFQSFSTKAGTPLLLWSMLLAVFPLAVYLCKTAYERFTMYCMTVFIFIFCDLFRYLLLMNIPGNHSTLIAFWVSLVAGVGTVGGILYGVNRLTKGEEKK